MYENGRPASSLKSENMLNWIYGELLDKLIN